MRKVNIIFLLSLFILISCEKEKLYYLPYLNNHALTWIESDCHESFDKEIHGGEQIVEEGNQYKYPAFNPRNSNEIIYYEMIADSGSSINSESNIIKYNYINNSRTILLSNVKVASQINWNNNGWIAFKAESGFIFIVKDDGSELQQFSDYPSNQSNDNLCWLNKSDTLLWRYNNLYGDDYLKQKVIGQDSIISIYTGVFSNFNISNKILLLTYANQKFKTRDLKNISSNSQIVPTALIGDLYGNLLWNLDGSSFYASILTENNGSGLYIVNANNGNQTKLISYCEKQQMKYFDLSPDGQKLIIQKVNRSVKFNGDIGEVILDAIIIEKSTIWLVDLKTLKTAKLPL